MPFRSFLFSLRLRQLRLLRAGWRRIWTLFTVLSWSVLVVFAA